MSSMDGSCDICGKLMGYPIMSATPERIYCETCKIWKHATKEQRETMDRLIRQHGNPTRTCTWDNVVFMEYSFGSIGIELDGYSHM